MSNQKVSRNLGQHPPDQKRHAVQTYHKVLGELRSMSLTLPGLRGLFRAMQEVIRHKQGKKLRLTSDFHATLDDFRWLHADLSNRPTRLQEIVPTPPTIYGAHDASGAVAGGVILPDAMAIPRKATVIYIYGNKLHAEQLQHGHPIVWRQPFDSKITDNLVSWENPRGKINNSELELAGGILHNEAAAHCFDIRERTMKASTDNTATMHWMRKGSVTGLRMQGCPSPLPLDSGLRRKILMLRKTNIIMQSTMMMYNNQSDFFFPIMTIK